VSTLGTKSDRLVKIGEGSVVVAFVRISDAPIAEGESAFGVKSDRLVVISEGAVVVAFVRKSVASANKGESAFGIEADRLVVIGDGPVVVASLGICIALADKGSVACSRFGFRSFALLLLRRPESSNSLLLDFLTLALSFRLGRCSCLALLLRCQPLFPCLLQLAAGFRSNSLGLYACKLHYLTPREAANP
jgi:hypothetical protein